MRHISRVAVAAMLAVGLVASLLLPRRAAASDVWCWDDPAILVDGVPIAINLGFRVQQLGAIDGVDITIEVPDGVIVRMLYLERSLIVPTVRIVTTESGPLADGESGSEGDVRVKVTVMVRSSQSFDYAVNMLNAGYSSIAPHTTSAYTNQEFVGSIQLHAA